MTLQYQTKTSSGGETLWESILRFATGWSPVVFIIVCTAMVAIAARDGLSNLYDRWMFEKEYDYGFLVAALVPLFLWGRRWSILALSTDDTWYGLLLVIIAQLCAIVGNLGESYYVEQVTMVLTLLGLLIVIYGTGPFRIFIPLTTLLLLAVPLPYTLQAIFTIKLQLLSTNIGAGIIGLFGIPVFVDGNIVDLGLYKLQVAEACSGLRYLFPLICIGFIVAFLYKAKLWKRAIVVASAFPLTILINSFRIAVTAVFVNIFGSGAAAGFFHWFEGWVIFCIGAVLLCIEILILEQFHLANVNIEPVFAPRPSVIPQSSAPVRLGWSAIGTLFVCALALGTVSIISMVHGSSLKPSRENFSVFPQKIGEWSGREAYLQSWIPEVLKATDYYMGDFSKGQAAPVNLFVAYYDSLAKGAAIHSPRVCLPGAGWEFASFKEEDFANLVPGMRGTFNRVVIQKGTEKMLMYYWFQQRERRTASEFSMKYYLLLDSLAKGRKDGALVRFLTPIATSRERGEAEADSRLHAFARGVLPRLSDYLPR
ncbi:MAG: VPLPA-CTERM-specific exosortase XrtD [Methylovirgula sp.]